MSIDSAIGEKIVSESNRWPYGPCYAVSVDSEFICYNSGSVVRIASASNNNILSEVELPSHPSSMVLVEELLFAVCDGNTLITIDLVSPEDPQIIAAKEFDSKVLDIGSFSDYMFLITEDSPRFRLYDAVDVFNLKLVGTFEIPSGTTDSAVDEVNELIYLATGRHIYSLSLNDFSNIWIDHLVELEFKIKHIAKLENSIHLFDSRNYYGSIQLSDLSFRIEKRDLQDVGSKNNGFVSIRDVLIRDSLIYVSEYDNGLSIYRLIDSTKIVLMDHRETKGYTYFTDTQNDFVFLCNGKCFVILKVSSNKYLEEISIINLHEHPFSLRVVDNFAYVVSFNSGLKIIDVENPETPKVVGEFLLPERTRSVEVFGNYAYLMNDSLGLCILNISDPQKPKQVGNFKSERSLLWCSFKFEQYLLVGATYECFVLDISDPAKPISVGHCITRDSAYDIIISERNAYIAGENGLFVLDLMDLKKPIITSKIETGSFGGSICRRDDYIFLSNRKGGVKIFQVQGDSKLELIDESQIADFSMNVSCSDKYLINSKGSAGISVFYIGE